MKTINTIFTCAAIGNAASSADPDIFWMLVLILLLDDDARSKAEQRRKREQAGNQPQALSKPKPPAGPR